MDEQVIEIPSRSGRPWLLSAFIVASALFAVFEAFSAATLFVDALRAGRSDIVWLAASVGAIAIVRLVALVATWQWKRWGVYLWFACVGLGIYQAHTVGNLKSGVFLVLVGSVLFAALVFSRWSDLE